MNINQKLDEIRSKPEHIRLRWAWGGVILSMIVIISIWVFSISMMFKKENTDQENSFNTVFKDLKEQTKNTNQQSPSLSNYTEKSLDIDSEGISSTQTNKSHTGSQTSDVKTSKTKDHSPSTTEAPTQSNAYSDLESQAQ